MQRTILLINAPWDGTNKTPLPHAGGINTWDDGYPSGGNYWGDYNGTDFYHGPEQKWIDPDGIGDSPYVINDHTNDNYPLMTPIFPLYSELWEQDSFLLEDIQSVNTELLLNLDSLNATYQHLLSDYAELQENYTSLESSHNRLQNDFNSLNSTYSNLNATFNGYKESTNGELSHITFLMYVLIATTIVLLATTIYLAIRKSKTKSET
jgi:hypothetical protein